MYCNKTDDLGKKLKNVGKIHAEKLLMDANIKAGLEENEERTNQVADANLQVRKYSTKVKPPVIDKKSDLKTFSGFCCQLLVKILFAFMFRG